MHLQFALCTHSWSAVERQNRAPPQTRCLQRDAHNHRIVLQMSRNAHGKQPVAGVRMLQGAFPEKPTSGSSLAGCRSGGFFRKELWSDASVPSSRYVQRAREQDRQPSAEISPAKIFWWGSLALGSFTRQ
jgi:hypothetical protein